MSVRGLDSKVVETPLDVVRAGRRDAGRAAVAAGYPGDEAERTLLEKPEILRDFFSRWAAAGAGVLLAPTGRATPAGLRPLGLAQHCRDVNRLGVELLQEVAAADRNGPFVAAQMGPFYSHPDEPASLPFDRMYAQYHEQTKPLATVDPDLIILRRIDDLRALRAALVAVRELWSGPLAVVVRSGEFDDNASPALETDREAVVELLRNFDVEGLGFSGAGSVDPRRLPFQRAEESGFVASVIELGAFRDSDHGIDRERVHDVLEAGMDLVLVEADPINVSANTRESPRQNEIRAAESESPVSRRTPVATRRSELLALVPAAELSAVGPDRISSFDAAVPAGRADRLVGVWMASDGGAGDVEPWALEQALRSVEERAGVALGILSTDPGDLESCAKAAARPPVLVFGGEQSFDHDCVLYLTRRYGTRSVIRIDPRPGASLDALAAEVCASLRRCAGESSIPWGSIYLDVTGPRGGPVGSTDREFNGALRRIRRELGVRWAFRLGRRADNAPPAVIPPSLAEIDLVIVEYAACP